MLGPELLKNGDMEQNGGWSKMMCGKNTLPKVMEIVTTEKHGGDSSLHVVIERQDPQDYPFVSSNAFETKDGIYKISFWYKITKGSFRVEMRNGADNNYVGITKRNLLGDDSWQYYEGEYQERSPGLKARIGFYSSDDGECEMYLDDVSVKQILP